MNERHVFKKQRHERYDWWPQVFNHGSIVSMISRRIKSGLEFREGLLESTGQFLPHERHAADCHVAQAHDDGKKRVKVLIFFATFKTTRIHLLV